ncbi:MAG: hypothetical protein PHS80_11800 [Methanothrix sp.]|nr:hypothetical protein [Methanothrix sp.]MDD4448659.1 hypothetical protein [Methanothrix sp.]
MKFEFLIALVLVISALFTFHACAIIDGGSGLSADELIDASNGIYVFNNGIPENPQASRKLWSEESGINFTMPGKLSGSSTNPQEARSSASTGEALTYQTASTVSESTVSTGGASYGQAKAVLSPQPTVSPIASVAGNWSFRLKDSKNRFMALSLFQSESTVLGMGNINDGGDTLKVLASGLISADKLRLDVISSGIVNLYRLTLNLSGSSASGEYKAFSTKGETWIGTAEGMLGVN